MDHFNSHSSSRTTHFNSRSSSRSARKLIATPASANRSAVTSANSILEAELEIALRPRGPRQQTPSTVDSSPLISYIDYGHCPPTCL